MTDFSSCGRIARVYQFGFKRFMKNDACTCMRDPLIVAIEFMVKSGSVHKCGA